MNDKEERKPEVSVLFVVSGHFLPDDISAVMGIGPDRQTAMGSEIRPGTGHIRRQSSWELRANGSPAGTLADQIKSILLRLRGREAEVVSLARQHLVGFDCTVKIYDAQGPDGYLDSELIQAIARLEAYVGVDIYCLGDSDLERDGYSAS